MEVMEVMEVMSTPRTWLEAGGWGQKKRPSSLHQCFAAAVQVHRLPHRFATLLLARSLQGEGSDTEVK